MAKANCPEKITYLCVSKLLKVGMLRCDDLLKVSISELLREA